MQTLWGEPTVASPLEVDVSARRAALAEFSNGYENLIEIVCDAANLGVSEKLSARFRTAYPEFIRTLALVHPFVVAFLESTEPDGFQWFAQFETLPALLDADDGNLIGRIMETRAAMNDYADHLQRLSANRE